ncbi:MAG: GDP-L-fucose synthase [Bacteroidales bacterium]|nr:GDP-L-fucose synthase [Bacteroidales bacterium]
MEKSSKIYLAGHDGLVGSAILKNLQAKGYTNIVTRKFQDLNLIDQGETASFFEAEKPEFVFLAAAKVGGIMANSIYRAQFIYENIQIQNNVIHQSYLNGVKKLLFLGSSCIYPKNATQPLKEDYLLTSELEFTNEPYAIAKIAGIKMCESYNIQYNTNFISVMPTNLYGPGDNFNLQTSHVLPALIRKMHLGKCLEESDWAAIRNDLNKNPVEGISGDNSNQEIIEVLKKYGLESNPNGNEKTEVQSPVSISLWGTGNPRREFLHTDDMTNACIYLMENINFSDLDKNLKEIKNTHINIGCGKDQSIKDLAQIIKEIVGFKGNLNWDSSKPDGTFQKLMDTSKLNSLGWKYKIELIEGITNTYNHYLKVQ